MTNPKLKYLEDVPWDNSLKLSNGKTVHGLEQLPMVIKFSDDEVFTSHVNDQKNDFSNWIRDVIGDTELATQLLSIKTKDEFLKFMDKAITDIKQYNEPEPIVQPAPLSTAQPVVQSAPQQPVITPQPIVQSVPTPQPAVSPSVVQPTSQTIVFPPPQPVQEPTAKPASPPTPQQVEQLARVQVPKNSPFVSESQMMDAPVSPIVQTVETPLENKPTAIAPVENKPAEIKPEIKPEVKPVEVPEEKPVVTPVNTTQSAPETTPTTPTITPTITPTVTPVVAPTVTPVVTPTITPAATPVVAPVDVPTVSTVASVSNVSTPVEETFEFEEIFKVLITELEQEVLAWDVQTS